MTPSLVPDTALTDEAVWAVFVPDGDLLADEGGQILLANRQIEALFGFDRGDVIGRSVDRPVARVVAAGAPRR